MKRFAEQKVARRRRDAEIALVRHKTDCPVCSKDTVAISTGPLRVENARVFCEKGLLLAEQKAFFGGFEAGIWRGVGLGWNRARAR